MTYRADGRPASEAQGVRTTTFGYDASGRPTQLTDATGAVTGFGFDAARRLSSIAQPSPVTGDVGIARDAGGNTTGLTTPLGPQYGFAFRPTDAVRQTTPPSVGAVPASDPTTLTYDADRTLIAADVPGASDFTLGFAANGRLEAITADGAGVTTSSYDGAGRLAGLDAPTQT